MINYLSEELNTKIKLSVFSTHNNKNRAVFDNKKVKIYRTVQAEGDNNRFFRLLKYIIFQLFVFVKLIIDSPEKILYYESLSSFPVYLYKRFINSSVKIYIHYHEYTTPEQYAKNSMAIERYFHKLEQNYIYKNAIWISHTNKDRLKMFFNDNPNINKNSLKEMPNYPPKSWIRAKVEKRNNKKTPLKCVYIGSLSYKSTYIKEFVEWILLQKGSIIFDIFSYNLYSDIKQYLQLLQSPYINYYNEGVEYDKLPYILSKYNVGIILYKGQTKNFEFNAPNKLFEYLTCDLDVWFPDVMKGITIDIQTKSSKKVIPVNFEQINDFDWKDSIYSGTAQKKLKTFVCNTVYEELKKELER